ncbi:hypothetical protein FGB62_1g694 [Gracilaria domingensis]|nr:hypothetical protein FGB62_1g694 [Gracilaria domingensis]
MDCSAFVQPSFSSAFTPARAHRATVSRRPTPATPARIVMAEGEKKPFFRNPFAAKPKDPNVPDVAFIAPQPGDPGYKEPALAKPAAEAEPAKKAGSSPTKLPVVAGEVKRGFDLLREDVLKSAPERAGVGRQDADSVVMRPQAGEPGYKPAAYQTVQVSKLGISTFSDDKNYVSKVGGIDAVKQAALDIKTGQKTGKEIKREALMKAQNITKKAEAPKVYDIPDYLKPLPEDTPRKGMTWKNY